MNDEALYAAVNPGIDPVAVSITVLAGWLGPTLASVVGTYFVIILSAAAGAGWALMRRDRSTAWGALGFVALMIVTATMTTAAVNTVISRYTSINDTYLLPLVALTIAGVGSDWARVIPWGLETFVGGLMSARGFGPPRGRQYLPPPGAPPPRYREPTPADEEPSGAVRDDD